MVQPIEEQLEDVDSVESLFKVLAKDENMNLCCQEETRSDFRVVKPRREFAIINDAVSIYGVSIYIYSSGKTYRIDEEKINDGRAGD